MLCPLIRKGVQTKLKKIYEKRATIDILIRYRFVILGKKNFLRGLLITIFPLDYQVVRVEL